TEIEAKINIGEAQNVAQSSADCSSQWGLRGAISVDGFNHGGNLIFSNGPKRFKSLRGKKLHSTHFPHLNIVRPVVGPYEILPVPAEADSRPAPVAVRQLLVFILENLPGQLGVRHDHIEV
ncbi:hypothetical protein V2J09_013610, partial [Rumex salicifolius]